MTTQNTPKTIAEVTAVPSRIAGFQQKDMQTILERMIVVGSSEKDQRFFKRKVEVWNKRYTAAQALISDDNGKGVNKIWAVVRFGNEILLPGYAHVAAQITSVLAGDDLGEALQTLLDAVEDIDKMPEKVKFVRRVFGTTAAMQDVQILYNEVCSIFESAEHVDGLDLVELEAQFKASGLETAEMREKFQILRRYHGKAQFQYYKALVKNGIKGLKIGFEEAKTKELLKHHTQLIRIQECIDGADKAFFNDRDFNKAMDLINGGWRVISRAQGKADETPDYWEVPAPKVDAGLLQSDIIARTLQYQMVPA